MGCRSHRTLAHDREGTMILLKFDFPPTPYLDATLLILGVLGMALYALILIGLAFVKGA